MTNQTSYTLHFRSPSGDLLSWEQFHSNGYHAAGEAFKAALAREYPDGKGGTAATWILLRKTEKDPLEQALKSIETGTLALRATLKSQTELADFAQDIAVWLVAPDLSKPTLSEFQERARIVLRGAGRPQ